MRKMIFIFVMALLFIPGNGFSQQIDTSFWGNKPVFCDLVRNKDTVFGDQAEFLKFLTVTGSGASKNSELSLYVKSDGNIFVVEGNNDFFCIAFIGNNMKLFRQQKSLDNKDTF